MTIDEAYRIYTTIRLHFNSDTFDIRSGVIPKRPKNGVKERFSKQMEKILKLYNHDKDKFTNYWVANFLSESEWGALYAPEGEEVYMEWLRVQESLSYVYKQDVEYLASLAHSIDDLWDCGEGHPIILKSYLGKKCHLETLVILNKLFNFKYGVDEGLFLDPVWSSVARTIHKYSPFVNVNKKKFLDITQKAFMIV